MLFRAPACLARRLSTVLPMVFVVLFISACGKDNDDAAKKKAAAAAPQVVPVAVRHVQPQRIPISLEAVGRGEGSREVEVRARISGIIEKRLFAEGAPVRAGAVLFAIDRATYEIAVAQAKAALSQERAKADLSQREADRLKSLAQARAISQREYDVALSAVQQAAAAIEGAQAKLAEAQLNLSYTKVTAPISGITGRALRSEGSLVTVNTETALLTTLTQVDPIWVLFSLAEPDYERIRGAQARAQVHLVNQDGSIAAKNGRLNFAGSTVDPKLGTVQLRAEFPNPAQKWMPGQFVKVHILAGEQDAFLVPQEAVAQTEQGRFVWIAEADGKASMRPVQTAGWVGNDWVVTSGLKPGDAVVVDNLMKMRPGVSIQARTAAPEAAPAGAPAAPVSADKKTSPAPAR